DVLRGAGAVHEDDVGLPEAPAEAPLVPQRPGHGHQWGDPAAGREEEVSVRGVEGAAEQAERTSRTNPDAHRELLVQPGGRRATGNLLDGDRRALRLLRGGRDRVAPLDRDAAEFEAEGQVLPGLEPEPSRARQ